MHIDDKPLNRYPLWLKPFFWSQKRRYGMVLKPGLLWARVPKLFAAVALLYAVLDRKGSPLSPVIRSLVTVRVSQINHCAFCVDINAATLIRRAGTEDKIDALSNWQQSDIFDATERIVLAYTEAITYSDREVTPALMAELKVYFSDDEVVELTGLIAFQNLSSKFNGALDVPAQGFCSLPAAKILGEDAGSSH